MADRLSMSRRERGELLKREGIAHALAGAPDSWVAAAYDAVRTCAYHLLEFTTDDVQDLLVDVGVGEPRDSRAWGGVMVAMANEGVCASTGRYRRSEDPACHRRPKAIWESCVYHDSSVWGSVEAAR